MAISIDTRTIQPGDWFIPVQGDQFNGRDFIPDAIKKGAKILDVDIQRYAKSYRKKLRCHVIGITGSAGKTTMKDTLYAVLSQRYRVVKTEENQNNQFGVPLTILKADFNTDILIVEMGMRGLGEIDELARIARPTHCLITTIGTTHIELLGSQYAIARAKTEIFLKALPWEISPRVAYLNESSPYYDYQMKRAKRAGFIPKLFGGLEKPEQNVNAAYLIGREFGLSDSEIRSGFDAYTPSSHRMISLSCQGVTVLDDSYNANPDGMTYALQQLKRQPGRHLLVVGDMLELGATADEAHQAVINEAIEANVSVIFSYGHHWAKVSPQGIPFEHFLTHQDLINRVLSELKKGDVVLVKGSRSMKMEQVVTAIQDRAS